MEHGCFPIKHYLEKTGSRPFWPKDHSLLIPELLPLTVSRSLFAPFPIPASTCQICFWSLSFLLSSQPISVPLELAHSLWNFLPVVSWGGPLPEDWPLKPESGERLVYGRQRPIRQKKVKMNVLSLVWVISGCPVPCIPSLGRMRSP